MPAIKYSHQREAVKNCLLGRMDHPTAEMIYEQIRREDPRISLGTVYRNLSLLVQLGEIRRIPVADGPDHFDGDMSRHFHFICRRCHAVKDLRSPELGDSLERLLSEQSDRAEDVVLNVYGCCSDCCGIEQV